MNHYKGIFYAICSSIAFGVMPGFAKLAYLNGSNPTTVLIARFSLSALLLLLYLNYKKISIKVSLGQFSFLVLTGFIGYTLTTQTLFMSYEYLGGGLATTFHFIYPVVVCIMGVILFKEHLGKPKLLALALSALGVYALVAFDHNALSAIGVTLALFSGVSYGLTVIALSVKSVKSLDNRVVTMYVALGAAVGMVLYGVCKGTITLNFNFQIVTAYLGISIISTICSIILLLKAIHLIGAGSASILATFEPIVSIIVGILFFGEPLTVSLIIGIFLIFISTIILGKQKEACS
ncbi:MAG: DMT family transporter [Cellulosilyticaceae bacterium]